ncbi:hypothetical protein U7230_02300 [Carboxydochorda subterranea]|uniref:Uncharacterized protein n=1 Tax=Carboxydichorda subterranea TaxID=3109565 RepID=A0ABZ1BYT8_9FIRM|nr:hypothetical protein [Limnochorda sp. L945t]WRP17864.1 hypothetical protein U7230_02300 [Limnochorda sp. L945t]
MALVGVAVLAALVAATGGALAMDRQVQLQVTIQEAMELEVSPQGPIAWAVAPGSPSPGGGTLQVVVRSNVPWDLTVKGHSDRPKTAGAVPATGSMQFRVDGGEARTLTTSAQGVARGDLPTGSGGRQVGVTFVYVPSYEDRVGETLTMDVTFTLARPVP